MPTPCLFAETHVGFLSLTHHSAETGRSLAWAGEEADKSVTSQVLSVSPPQRRGSHDYHQNPMLLQVSDDANLSSSRLVLLRMAGFDVYTCGSTQVRCLEEALARHFIAAVFCQSVPQDIAVPLSHMLSDRNRRIAIVRISGQPWQEESPDAYSLLLQAPIAPVELIRTMMQLRAHV